MCAYVLFFAVHLQIVENPLQAERNGLLQALPILDEADRRHPIDCIPEGSYEEEGLNDTVQIASGSLIFEALEHIVRLRIHKF